MHHFQLEPWFFSGACGHYNPGSVRTPNAGIIDQYQLKSLDSVGLPDWSRRCSDDCDWSHAKGVCNHDTLYSVYTSYRSCIVYTMPLVTINRPTDDRSRQGLIDHDTLYSVYTSYRSRVHNAVVLLPTSYQPAHYTHLVIRV